MQAATMAVRTGAVRLNAWLARQKLCSRREADDFIRQGLVLVDGQPASLGQRVAADARVELLPAARAHQANKLTFMLHKPLGFVSGQAEHFHTPALNLIKEPDRFFGFSGPSGPAGPPPDELIFDRQRRAGWPGLAPCGRLDEDSTGLLVLSQDGRVARALVGDHSDIDKEYQVKIRGEVDEGALRLLRSGLHLDGQPLRPAKVTRTGSDMLRIVLRQGRKRQLRRMCGLVGVGVESLRRVRIGPLRLDVPLGQWRVVHPAELGLHFDSPGGSESAELLDAQAEAEVEVEAEAESSGSGGDEVNREGESSGRN